MDDFDAAMYADDWKAITLPLSRVQAPAWLQTSFYMPPNDECMRWFFHAETTVKVRGCWVNERKVPAGHDKIDITNYVAIGQNELVLRVTVEDGDAAALQAVECIGYRCG